MVEEVPERGLPPFKLRSHSAVWKDVDFKAFDEKKKKRQLSS